MEENNKERVVYKYYPYTRHIGIDKNTKAKLPAIHSSERMEYKELVPINKKITIKS